MKKILVVDDEKDIRDLIKEALTKEKFSVITVSSGEEAIVLAKTDKPHLILLDIAMPGMDGYITCEELQKDSKTRNIPVLFLTGKDLDEQSIIGHCQNLCAAGYVSKTSSLKDLLEKVKEALFRS
ncbi:MAG: response regulator [Candidatus Omnitrophica bacterium]|nr:response regulator [Candidatus Omnitrophota bacterium]